MPPFVHTITSPVAFQQTYLVGLIGAGIQASRTPAMHEREGAEQGLRYTYRLIDLEKLGAGADALPELIANAERAGFAGLNITYPCKQTVLPDLVSHLPGDRAPDGLDQDRLLRRDAIHRRRGRCHVRGLDIGRTAQAHRFG